MLLISKLLLCCCLSFYSLLSIKLLQNSPDDLQLLADAPNHKLFCLIPKVDEESRAVPDVFVAIQVCIVLYMFLSFVRKFCSVIHFYRMIFQVNSCYLCLNTLKVFQNIYVINNIMTSIYTIKNIFVLVIFSLLLTFVFYQHLKQSLCDHKLFCLKTDTRNCRIAITWNKTQIE